MIAVVFFVYIRTCAKRGHLDDLAAKTDMRKAKSPPNQPAITKQLPNLIRARIGNDVEILGFAA